MCWFTFYLRTFVRQQFGGKLLPYHSLHSRWKFELELKLNWSGVGIEIARPKLKPVTESSDVGVDREIEKERAITVGIHFSCAANSRPADVFYSRSVWPVANQANNQVATVYNSASAAQFESHWQPQAHAPQKWVSTSLCHFCTAPHKVWMPTRTRPRPRTHCHRSRIGKSFSRCWKITKMCRSRGTASRITITRRTLSMAKYIRESEAQQKPQAMAAAAESVEEWPRGMPPMALAKTNFWTTTAARITTTWPRHHGYPQPPQSPWLPRLPPPAAVNWTFSARTQRVPSNPRWHRRRHPAPFCGTPFACHANRNLRWPKRNKAAVSRWKNQFAYWESMLCTKIDTRYQSGDVPKTHYLYQIVNCLEQIVI